MTTIIKNGNIVDVTNDKIYHSDLSIKNGIINGIGSFRYSINTIDAKDLFLVPGLIDAHTHNEMLMLSPISFSELILPTGTTSVILDFHDLANVVGIDNSFKYLKNEFNKLPLKVFYTIPSCIPSSENIETSGYKVKYEDIINLFKYQEVVGLAEIMDINGLFNHRKELEKILSWAKKNKINIDGHCPNLIENALLDYIRLSGASTDHEFLSVNEAIEKLNDGLKLIFRRGITNEPNSYNIWSKIQDKSKFLLCTDGCTTVGNVIKDGYMDGGIRKLIKEGIPPIEAIKMATINVANHYNLTKVGNIKIGNYADLLFVSDLENFKIEKVMINGNLINKKIKFPRNHNSLTNSLVYRNINLDQFMINSKREVQKARVIGLLEDSLITEEIILELKTKNNSVVCDLERDILYISVINRYDKNSPIINGFVKGFGLKKGAIACSNAQDSQNIIVVGTNCNDMKLSVDELFKIGGGYVFTEDKNLIHKINLPIAGIMTNEDPYSFAKRVSHLEKQLNKNGCNLNNPLFALSLMFSVTSIPYIKITDKGLYDFNSNSFKEVILYE